MNIDDWQSEKATELRCRLIEGGALDDSIADAYFAEGVRGPIRYENGELRPLGPTLGRGPVGPWDMPWHVFLPGSSPLADRHLYFETASGALLAIQQWYAA